MDLLLRNKGCWKYSSHSAESQSSVAWSVSGASDQSSITSTSVFANYANDFA